MTRGLFKPTSAAEYLDVDVSTIYKLAARGVLEKRYIGKGTRAWRIPIESLEAYRNGLPTEPTSEAS